MRRIPTISAALTLCASMALAQTVTPQTASPQPASLQSEPPAGQQVEVLAATEAARADLRGQLLSVYIAPGVMLRDVLTDAPTIPLDTILAKADVVGQPRWIGDDIVQVKLHLMARELVNSVQTAKKTLAKRMSEADFKRFKADWINRSFQATGQAIPASRVRQVVTTLQPTAWVGVPDDVRADAAMRARSGATASLVDQTCAIRLSANQTVSNSFASDKGKATLTTWADNLPATNIMLRDDRQVEIGVFVDKPGLQDALKSSLSPSVLAQPGDTQALATGVSSLPDVVIGQAQLTAMPNAIPQAALVIRQVPTWASDPIVAQGDAKFSTTQLRTARAAERTAREALRDKVLALTVDNNVPLAQAQPQVAVDASINEAVERARVSQVDYHSDGSATVSVSLDPNDLLDALTGR